MSKGNKQGSSQKPQTNRQTNRDSIKGSGSAGGFNRSRKGTAGDGTGTSSTGPRKK